MKYFAIAGAFVCGMLSTRSFLTGHAGVGGLSLLLAIYFLVSAYLFHRLDRMERQENSINRRTD